jgi:nucleoside-diphosphate-sugar epimerase
LFGRIEWVNGDVLDYFSLENILQGVTQIYHCAAIVSFDPKERKRMISNNVEGTANLVNAAIENGIKRICHVSSIAALGRLENGLSVTEETNWVPAKRISGYSESKFFSEAEIWRGIEEGLDAVIVNPSIIFGPSNWETGSSKMFKTIWDGMKFYTKGVTGFVDVKDVVKAMILLMKEENFDVAKNQRYLLNSENLSYENVFTSIAGALNKPRPKYFASDFLLKIVWRAAKIASLVTAKPSMITRESVANSNAIFNFDGSKISKAFGFTYLPIAESIQQTAQFLKQDMAH